MADYAESLEEARKRYLKHMQDALDLLLTISNEVEIRRENASDLHALDWGDVGDAQHLKNRIQDIHDSVMREGEYA